MKTPILAALVVGFPLLPVDRGRAQSDLVYRPADSIDQAPAPGSSEASTLQANTREPMEPSE